eukprot:m.3974 g.3974  ORF g.3974 m.3974 type:complete len:737 (+) comp10031_c0_seq1:164-2374(+)
MASWTFLYILCRLLAGGACGGDEKTNVTEEPPIPTSAPSVDDQHAGRVFKTLDTIRMHLTTDERRTLQELIARDRANGRAQSMRPIIIIPAFASTRLRVWQTAGCKDGLANFKIGGDSWLDFTMFMSARRCWLDCVELDPLTQDDTPSCKSRPDEGVDAVTELNPGLILGPLSSVWKSFVDMAASLGFEPQRTLLAAPYDFRLAPMLLESRDGYFSRLKRTIEQAVTQAEKNDFYDGSAVVVGHSLGNVVFHYFTEWLKADLGIFNYQNWLDKYIHTFIAAAPPVLGAMDGLQGVLSGITFGLPAFPIHEARHLGLTFSSAHMMTPQPATPGNVNYEAMNPAPLRIPLAHIEFSGSDEIVDVHTSDVRNGNAYRRLGRYDVMLNYSAEQLSRFYDNDPIGHVINKPWPRPPIKRVVCAYGVGVPTTVAVKLRESEAVIADEDGNHRKIAAWDAYDILREEGVPRTFKWSSGNPTDDVTKRLREGVSKSGDGTVPYESLSWCHSWLGDRVNITRVPQETHFTAEDVERFLNVPVNHSLPDKPDPYRKYNVFFEHARWDDRRQLEETSVWELDGIKHRGLMESVALLRLLKTELLSSHFQHLSFHKLKRELADREQEADLQARIESRGCAKPPSVDEECLWDYAGAQCKWSKHCVYDYHFGDLHLSQSCRLRKDGKEKAESANRQVNLCKCVDDQCMSDFCKYEGNCERAVMAFGPSNGWWGPCTESAQSKSKQKNEL